MKVAKTLYIILIVTIMLLATSCDNEFNINEKVNKSEFNRASVNLQTTLKDISDQKDTKFIEITVDSSESNISYFKYRFTPQWDSNNDIEGDSHGWKVTTDFPTEWHFNFEQGKWTIEIEIYDKDNNKLGDTFTETKYMNKLDNSLCSGFYEWLVSTGTGSIYFRDIVMPKIYELPYHYEMAVNSDSIEVKNYYITWSLMNGSTIIRNGEFELKSTNNGLSTFGNVVVDDIPVGNYIITLSIKEGLTSTNIVTSGGEVTDISIFRNCTTNVSATVNTTDFIHCNFRAKQNETGYTGKIKAQYTSGSKNATLTLVAENATDIKWFQNGVYKPSYGNSTVANVSDIDSGMAGGSLIGTSSNYFDCTFTNSETGISSSCSYILVAGGSWGGSNTDGSIFTVNTGTEIKRWKYQANAIDALSTSFGEGSGIAETDAFFDERKWTIDATAYNNSNYELGSGTFTGYINKNVEFIDIPLDNNVGKGWITVGSIDSSRNLGNGTYKNRKLSWTIKNINTNEEFSGSTTLNGSTSSTTWSFNANESYEVDTGTYIVELTTECYYDTQSLIYRLARGTYYGHCIIIVNIYSGITTIVQGSLTTDGRD